MNKFLHKNFSFGCIHRTLLGNACRTFLGVSLNTRLVAAYQTHILDDPNQSEIVEESAVPRFRFAKPLHRAEKDGRYDPKLQSRESNTVNFDVFKRGRAGCTGS